MAFPIDRRLVRLKVTKTTIRTCLKGTESKVMAGQLFRSREGRSVEYSIRPSIGQASSFPLATSENPSKQ